MDADRKTAARFHKPLFFRQKLWETDDHFSVNMPARHQLQSIVDLRKVKFTGINLSNNYAVLSFPFP